MDVHVSLEPKSLYCLYCQQPWPVSAAYLECPVCREHTEERSTDAVSLEEAAYAKRLADFGWWLWENNRV